MPPHVNLDGGLQRKLGKLARLLREELCLTAGFCQDSHRCAWGKHWLQLRLQIGFRQGPYVLCMWQFSQETSQ